MQNAIYMFFAAATIISMTAKATPQHIAVYENGALSVPEIQAGNSLYKNVVIQLNENGLFEVVSSDLPIVRESKHASFFDQKSNTLTINYLSIGTNSFRDVKLKTRENLLLEYVTSIKLFSDITTRINTPFDYFPSEEADLLTLQMVATVDVNSDGLRDIVAHYWESNWTAPEKYFGETLNSLVVYVQDSDGSFRVSNEEIFGNKKVTLGGGASRKQVVADFNNDGFEDIAYAMNREDGRSWTNKYPEEEDNWANETAIFVSNGDGTYRIDLLEPKGYFHTIDKARNNQGGYDLVLSSLESCNENAASIAFRYEGDAALLVTEYPNMQGATASFLPTITEKEASNTLVAYRAACTEYPHLRLQKKNKFGWELVDQYNFYRSGTNVRVERFGEISVAETFRFSDFDYVEFASWESCGLRINPESPPIAIIQISGEILPEGFDKQTDVFKFDGERPQPFLAFDTSENSLRLLPELIPNQDKTHSFRFDCSDKTGDGFDDLIAYNADGTITLYKNNRANILEKVSQNIFPQSSVFSNGANRRAIYDDLNGDGFLDLIYYSNTPKTWGVSEWIFLDSNFEIFWGRSPIFDEIANEI